MRITVTGATGLIGRQLVDTLIGRGDQVVVLTRDVERARPGFPPTVEIAEWRNPLTQPAPESALAGADAVIHLAGEPVNQRWSASAREAIRASRVLPTANLVASLAALGTADRPRVLVSQSATGYYGPCGSDPVDESMAPGNDFLASVVVDWEQEARKAEPYTRVVRTRTGVVLARDGGALSAMLPIFKLGLGGPVGGGRQFVPWIHIDDVVAGLLRAVDDEGLTDALNLTAPTPVTNAEFSTALGHVLHRPAFWPVPGAVLKLAYGGMAALVLTGQRAVPARLVDAGFEFGHPEVEQALRGLLRAQ